jgi:hypothetical protein
MTLRARLDTMSRAIQTPGTTQADPHHPVPSLESRIQDATTRIHSPEKAHDEHLAQLTQLVAMQHQAALASTLKLTQLTDLLLAQSLNGILETRTVQFGADGGFGRTYRVPFASVWVMNNSGQPVTLTTNPKEMSAPSQGVGVVPIPTGISVLVPITGNHFQLYGTAGTLVTFSVTAKPVGSASSGQA